MINIDWCNNYGCGIGGQRGRGGAASAADAAAAVAAALRVGELAGRFAFTPLGAAVLEPDLNAGLAELQPQRQLLTSEYVRIGSPLERPLQLFQLVRSERRPLQLMLWLN